MLSDLDSIETKGRHSDFFVSSTVDRQTSPEIEKKRVLKYPLTNYVTLKRDIIFEFPLRVIKSVLDHDLYDIFVTNE